MKNTVFKNICVHVNTNMKKSDLTNAVFNDQILNGVAFDSASLKNASFGGATLKDVSFHHTEAKHAIFDGATMDKVTYALLKVPRLY